MRRRWQGGEFGDRDIRKGREEVWERFLSRWFYQDCAWWQSSLSCWLVEARRIFLHDIEADPRVGIPIGEEAGRSKGSHPFLDTCLTTESSPSFTFKTRHLGDSEMMVSRIPRLWSVKTAWFWAQQRETERTGLCCAFRPPRGSKCSSHSVPFSVMGSCGHQPTEPTPISPCISNAIHVKRYIHVIRQR
jgi:hypothetical protein